MLEKNRTKVAILVLFFCFIIFFSPAIFSKGKILSAGDIITSWPLFRLEKDYKPINSIAGDTLTQFEPWFKIMRDSWRSGEIPLWNSYNGSGAPLLGNSVSAVFYPLVFFVILLPLSWGYLLYYFFKLFLIGLFTFLYLRSIKIRQEVALIGAVAFGFSAFNISWLFWPHVNVVFILPLGLFLIEKWISSGSNWKSLFFWWSLSFAIAFFGGHPETFFHIMLVVFGYLLFRVLFLSKSFKEKLTIILQWCASTIWGVALSAVALLPFLEYLLNSTAWVERNQFSENPFFFHYSLAILQYFPEFFGSQVREHIIPGIGSAPYLASPIINFNEASSGFVGLSILLAAFLGLYNVLLLVIKRVKKAGILLKYNRITIFFTLSSLFSLAVIYKFPFVFDFITSLPIFKASSNTRLLLILGFSFVVMAAIFLERLFSKKEKESSAKIVSLSLLISIFVFLYISVRKLWYDSVVPKLSLNQTDLALIDAKHLWIMVFVIVFLVITFIILKLWQLKGKKNRRLYFAGFALILTLVFAETGLRFITYSNLTPKEYSYPEVSILEKAKEQSGFYRTVNLSKAGSVYPSNVNIMYGLRDIRNYDGSGVFLYNKLVSGIIKGDWSNHGNVSNAPLWFLNMIGAKSILTYKGQEKNEPLNSFQVQHKERGVVLLENPQVLPRAFIIYKVSLKSEEEAYEEMVNGNFDPSEKVIISSDSFPSSWHDSSAPLKAANIESYGNQYVKLEAASEEQGVLFISDVYFPGWRAYIDGKEVEIYRANYAFRAIVFPEGEHAVEFIYRPSSFLIGGLISLSFFAIGLIVFLLPGRFRERDV